MTAISSSLICLSRSDMWVRIFYEHGGRHEKVVTWKRSKEECQQFIEEKGGVLLKVVKYVG